MEAAALPLVRYFLSAAAVAHLPAVEPPLVAEEQQQLEQWHRQRVHELLQLQLQVVLQLRVHVPPHQQEKCLPWHRQRSQNLLP